MNNSGSGFGCHTGLVEQDTDRQFTGIVKKIILLRVKAG